MPLKGGKPSRQNPSSPAVTGKFVNDQLVFADAHQAFPQIDSKVLWGIYGTETGFGTNVKTSSAGAMGPMQFEPDTWQKYGAGGDINNLHDSVFTAARYLSALLNEPTIAGNMNAALNAYNGNKYGRNVSPYIRSVQNYGRTYGRGTDSGVIGNLEKGAQNLGSGVVSAVTKGPLDAFRSVEDAVKAIAKFVITVLDPTQWGKLLAETIAILFREIVKAIYKWTILPPWHWTERATDRYWQDNLAVAAKSDTATMATNKWNRSMFTLGFWSLGYFLLWGKADEDEVALSGNSAQKTVLGRNIQGLLSYKNGRGLKKGKKEIQEATPNKPEPKSSSATINTVRTVKVNRRRSVSVSSTSNTQDAPRRINDDAGATVEMDR